MLSEPLHHVSRFLKLGQQDNWNGSFLTAIKMAEARSNDDTTSTPEPRRGLQGEDGLSRLEGGQDPGLASPAV